MHSETQEQTPFEPIAPHYDGASAEAHFSAIWDKLGIAAGDPKRPGKPFSVVIPPPNVTGSLHMGHALNNTLQDVLVRYHRMDGDNVVWIPGFDHASIAVHWLLERQFKAEGTSRHALGREAFLKRAWAFKETHEQSIIAQQRRLGLSCDWQRQRFTLDEGLSEAVREAFVTLYEDGLIYRAERLVNWDPVTQTSVSDLEVVYEENVTQDLVQFAYPLADGDGELVVATTRPETMLGDTAVAVHPQDPRYKHLIGKTLKHPFVARPIPIIGDSVLVDPEFGTGAVKITPAHDFNDFAVGERHKLEVINILNVDGTLNKEAGPFEGLDVLTARAQIIETLDQLGLGRGQTPHTLSLGRSERSGAVLEPMLSPQWYVKAKPLARPALEAVRHGVTQFVPEGWQNTYNSWLVEIRDWCISRQLWWGHRIPAWTCQKCSKLHVAKQEPQQCASCQATELVQDDDVLDTWFSSALWPFSTMGWPKKTAELARWYPTATLVTSFDIIFFWVARMMMMGQHLMGEVPFKHVYIHALIRDKNGEKMSKTKGNVVDPLVMIDKFGCDAFRLTLVAQAGQGRDIRWDEARALGTQKFVNKLWQAWRFVAHHLPDPSAVPPTREKVTLGLFDRWILGRLRYCVRLVRESLDTYRFNDAAQALTTFVWDELCDWYLEAAKVVLYRGDEAQTAKEASRRVLLDCLEAVSRLLHPIAPFLGEQLYQQLRQRDAQGAGASHREPYVAQASYPRVEEFLLDEKALAEADYVASVIRGVRRMRADFNVPVKETVVVLARLKNTQAQVLEQAADVILALCKAKLEMHQGSVPAQSATALVDGGELVLPLGGLIDIEAEKTRLEKDLKKAQADVMKLTNQLSREDFCAKAPPEIIADKKAQKLDAQQRVDKLEGALARLA